MGSILCCQHVVGVFFHVSNLVCYCSPTALHPNFTKVAKLNGRRHCITMIILVGLSIAWFFTRLVTLQVMLSIWLMWEILARQRKGVEKESAASKKSREIMIAFAERQTIENVVLQTFNLPLGNIIIIGGWLYLPLQIRSREILPAIISLPIPLYCPTIMTSLTILCIHDPNWVRHRDDAEASFDEGNANGRIILHDGFSSVGCAKPHEDRQPASIFFLFSERSSWGRNFFRGHKNWACPQLFEIHNNMSVIHNTQRPESTLKKKSNSICYNAIQESVAMGESLTGHIMTEHNLADLLTKVTFGSKQRRLVQGILHNIFDNH